MNTTFDFTRFKNMLAWHLVNNKKFYLNIFVSFTLAWLFLAVFLQIKLRDDVYPDPLILSTSYSMFALPLIFGSCFFGFFALATSIFRSVQKKSQRINTRMLPASNLEKYLCMFLFISVGSLVLMLGALVVCDALQYLFSLLLMPGLRTSLIGLILQQDFHLLFLHGFENFWYPYIIQAAVHTYFIWQYTLCILGGSIYRKAPVVMTGLSVIVLHFVLLFAYGYLADSDFFDITCYTPDGTHSYISPVWCTVFIGVMLALSAFNIFLSYRIFTRLQVISNKWLNL